MVIKGGSILLKNVGQIILDCCVEVLLKSLEVFGCLVLMCGKLSLVVFIRVCWDGEISLCEAII